MNNPVSAQLDQDVVIVVVTRILLAGSSSMSSSVPDVDGLLRSDAMFVEKAGRSARSLRSPSSVVAYTLDVRFPALLPIALELLTMFDNAPQY